MAPFGGGRYFRNKQTDVQTHRQMFGHTDRCLDTQTDVRTYKQMFGHTDKTFRRTNKHMGQKSRNAKRFFVFGPIRHN